MVLIIVMGSKGAPHSRKLDQLAWIETGLELSPVTLRTG